MTKHLWLRYQLTIPSCIAMALAFEEGLGPAIARVRSSAIQSSTALTSQFVAYKEALTIDTSSMSWPFLLSPVLCTPSFHKRHSYRAHSCQLVNGLEALWHWLGQQSGKFLIVEDLQVASGRNLADSCRVPPVAWITVGALNENARVAETFGKHFAADVVQPNAFSNMSSRLLHDFVAIHVRQQSEAEALGVRWISEAIDGNGWLRSMESLAYA